MPLIVYVTFSDMDEAERVATAVVEARLAACANIFAPHKAVFHWDGAVQRAEEVAAIFKVTDEGYAALEAEIKARHSYECPCIVAWPIKRGYGPFLEWIEQETGA
jgi:periplasmic divalent cation tolerance protein